MQSFYQEIIVKNVLYLHQSNKWTDAMFSLSLMLNFYFKSTKDSASVVVQFNNLEYFKDSFVKPTHV